MRRPREPRRFTAEALTHLAQDANLELPAERHEAVSGVLQSMYAYIDRMDEVELGETYPATTFDARFADTQEG